MGTVQKLTIVSGTTERSDGDWHISKRTVARVADFIAQKHGQRPQAVVWATQIHSDHVIEVRSATELGSEGDGLFTKQPGIALTVQTADCVPVFVNAGSVVGLAHAGMAGTVKEIAPKLVATIAKRYDIDPATMQVEIGPHICAKCYTISPNNHNLLADYPAAKSFMLTRGNQQYFAMADMLQQQLHRAGVRQITSDPRCTHHDKMFSSRHGHDERHLSYIMLTKADA